MRICVLAACLAAPIMTGASQPAVPELDEAFHCLYNCSFQDAHITLNRYISAHPQDPLPYAVRASAYLFYELDRLGILESEFFESDRRIAEKKKLKPNPEVRALFLRAIEDAQTRASAVLAAHPDDRDGLFTMCVAYGLSTDYMALVEKHQIRSLSVAKNSNRYAQQLLKIDPTFYDAYLTTGVSEYLMGSVPFFVKWFVHFDNVQGSKEQGIKNVQLVAQRGHYLRPFAKILLAIAFLRDKKPQRTEQLLAEMLEEYPANPLIRKELAKVQASLAGDR